MEKIKSLVRKALRNPFFTAGVALTMAVLLIIVGDFLFNAISTLSIVAMVIFALTGTIAFCSAAIFIAKNKLLAFGKKKKIIFVTVIGAVFNLFWIVPLLIVKLGFANDAIYAGKFAMVAEGVLYSATFTGIFATLFYRKNKKAFVGFTSAILVLVITAGIVWAGFGKSVSEQRKVDFKSLDNALVNANAGWLLDGVPSYDGGKLSTTYNAGTMLAYDYLPELTGEETYMQVARDTDQNEFAVYCRKLVQNGFTLEGENKLNDNIYKTFQKDGMIVHTYYTAVSQEVRIVKDVVSTSPKAFSYVTEEKNAVEVYQYAILYENEHHKFGGAVEQCGMSYVIKLADNSLFVIDGGMYTQASDSAVDGFWDFCKEITGTQSGEKVKITCWFCTHGHDDHMQFFSKILARFDGEYVVERVMFNFPSASVVTGSESCYTLKQRLKKYASDAMLVKCHTGQQFTLGGMTIDVLYTHEDAFDAVEGSSLISNFNDSSTVLRFSFDGVKMLLLGDIDNTAESVICNMHSENVFDAEIVQVAHHGFNLIDKLYDRTTAKYYLYPQSENNVTRENGSGQAIYNYIKETHPDAQILFARDYTYGLKVQDGELVLSSRPYVGEAEFYDGSPV